MKDIQKEIINYIRINRVSTTEVADCLGKKGLLEDIKPINSRKFCVGKAFYAFGINESHWYVHEKIRDVKKDEIVIVDNINCGKRSLLGELVVKWLVVYKEVAGVVVHGNVRDAHRIIKENYPVWSKGVSPIGCFHEEIDLEPYRDEIEKRAKIYEDAIIVADDSGVVLIPKEIQNEEFLQKLVDIEEQEDIWFDCIDRRKWNTFDVVCKKRYLEEDK